MRWLWISITIIAAIVLLIYLTNNNDQLTIISNSQLNKLTYAGILATVIAASILSSGIPLSNIIKYTLIWIAIIAILMGGYNNRYHLQDIAHNVSGGLIPASVLSIDLSGKKTVTIDQGKSGHYQVNGTINGHNVHFLIDTGATSIVLTSETALDLGLNIKALHFTTAVSTANGSLNAAKTRLDSISIGSITRKNLYALIAPSDVLSENLLGMNFINTLTSTSIRGSQLLLID